MFSNLLKSAARVFGLGKQARDFSGLVNKARSVIGTGMNFLRSAPVKSIVKSISEHIPTVGQYYNDAKKYGAIASNLLNGGVDRKIDRFARQGKSEAPTIERVPRQMIRRSNPFAESEADLVL